MDEGPMKAKKLSDLLTIVMQKYPRDIFSYSYGEDGQRDEILTYSELHYQANDKAEVFKPLSGNIVLYIENSKNWAVYFFAILISGNVAVIIDSKLASSFVLKQIEDCQAACVITDTPKANELVKLLAEKASLKNIMVYDVSEENFLPDCGLSVKCDTEKDKNLAVIMYTSGSTGNPKGVMLTHEGLLSIVIHSAERVPAKMQILAFVPFSHILGLTNVLLGAMWKGYTIVFPKSLKPTSLLHLLKDCRISVIIGPPIFYEVFSRKIYDEINKQPPFTRFLLRSITSLNGHLVLFSQKIFLPFARALLKPLHKKIAPQLRLLISGGAKINKSIACRLLALGYDFREGYGLTESGGVVCLSTHNHLMPGAVGSAIKGVSVKIDAPNQTGIGEIIVQGKQVMQGYYRNPAASREVLIDGWLHTGDLGYFDAHHNLHLMGRSKDVIVTSSGEKVYPDDIEIFFKEKLSGISEICICGVPKEGNAVVTAFIRPDEELISTQQTEKFLLDFKEINLQLPSHAQVQKVILRLEEFPKTPSHKILRHKLIPLASN